MSTLKELAEELKVKSSSLGLLQSKYDDVVKQVAQYNTIK
jgi:hypothetical protein